MTKEEIEEIKKRLGAAIKRDISISTEDVTILESLNDIGFLLEALSEKDREIERLRDALEHISRLANRAIGQRDEDVIPRFFRTVMDGIAYDAGEALAGMMENLELIKCVANALGWPVLLDKWPARDEKYPCLMTAGETPYRFTDFIVHREWDPTTNLHDAIDAVEEFCEKNELEAVVKFKPKYKYAYVALWDWEIEAAPLMSSAVEDTLPLAISKAIVEAKRVIDERGKRE